LFLVAALALVCLFLRLFFNGLVLGSFNSSLASSRKIQHSLLQHGFIILLAVVVNLSLRLVGVLLINALLIVPAATAMNWSRNLRQMFWLTLVISTSTAVGGLIVSWECSTLGYPLGTSGAIVLLNVSLFVVSLFSLNDGNRQKQN
jgi:zinc transport system permease protein